MSNAVTLTFAGDTKSLDAAAARANKSLDSVGSHTKSASGQIGHLDDQLDKSAKGFRGTADLLDGLATTMGLPGAQAITLARGFADIADGLKDAVLPRLGLLTASQKTLATQEAITSGAIDAQTASLEANTGAAIENAASESRVGGAVAKSTGGWRGLIQTLTGPAGYVVAASAVVLAGAAIVNHYTEATTGAKKYAAAQRDLDQAVADGSITLDQYVANSHGLQVANGDLPGTNYAVATSIDAVNAAFADTGIQVLQANATVDQLNQAMANLPLQKQIDILVNIGTTNTAFLTSKGIPLTGLEDGSGFSNAAIEQAGKQIQDATDSIAASVHSVGGGGGGGGGSTMKKAAIATGKAWVDGIAVGINHSAPTVADAIQGVIDAAKAKLTAARAIASQIKSAFASTLTAQTTDPSTNMKSPSLLQKFKADAANMHKFVSVIHQLQKKGLRGDLISKLVDAGPDGLAAAQEILNSGDIKELNDIQKGYNKDKSSLANSETYRRTGTDLTKAQPVKVTFDVTGADKEFKALIKKIVRVDGGGDVAVAFNKGGK